MIRRCYVTLNLLLIIAMASGARAQDTLKIMSYNLLNYGSSESARDPYYRTVLRHVSPDVLVVQEILSQTAVDNFYNNVVNVLFPGQFVKGTFIDGPDTDNAIYCRTSKFAFLSNTAIRTTLRNISEFKLYNAVAADTLRIFSVHLKASSGSSNEAQRAAEVDSLRKVTNALATGKFFIVCGDFNIYGSTEQAYQKLLQDNPGDDGHFNDALTLLGTWNTASYAPFHTQSPRVRSFGGGSTGGMDDRFDMILYSRALSEQGRMRILTSSITPVGNDGNHYNDSINRLPNAAVPDSVANALHYAADHLPVYAKFVVTSTGGTTYNISASAGPNGSISPSGTVTVPSGGNQSFTMSPSSGYHIDSLIVDGTYAGSPPTYTFTNVTSAHTIRAVFALNQYTIVAVSGPHGLIMPSGAVTVNHGTNQSFTFSPDFGYEIDSLIVDGQPQAPNPSYQFLNVTGNHSITVKFRLATLSSQFGVKNGWNIISVPVVVSDERKSSLFPTSISEAFAFAPAAGYLVRDSLKHGNGYWLKFPSDQNVGISGTILERDSIAVQMGWNMVGSSTLPVAVESVLQIPSNIIVSGFYGYNGGYATVDTLRPGGGYWVKVNQNGRIVLR